MVGYLKTKASSTGFKPNPPIAYVSTFSFFFLLRSALGIVLVLPFPQATVSRLVEGSYDYKTTPKPHKRGPPHWE